MISRSTVLIIVHIRNNIYYPDSLKVAKVTSIYKKNNKRIISKLQTDLSITCHF